MSYDVNNKCEICGAVELIPFRCKHCGGVFCGDHRLPENHNCKSRRIENYIITVDPSDNEHCSPKTKPISTNQVRSPFKTYQPPQKYRQKRKSRVNRIAKKLLHLPKRIIYSNLFGLLIVLSILAILGIGYYVYIYDPNTVQLSYYNGGSTVYLTNSTGAKMNIHNNPNATNPTYQQLINFILSDNTDQITYRNGKQVCIDYAVQVHDNAEKAGIRAGIVSLDFNYGEGHALNVFNTTDRGTVFIDCTGYDTYIHNMDKIASFGIGSRYNVQPITNIGNYYYEQIPGLVTSVRTWY